jgi:outer membrane protein
MACAVVLWQTWGEAGSGLSRGATGVQRPLARRLNVRVESMQSRLAIAAGVAVLLAAGAVHAQSSTLQDALAAAYANNPTLQAARAQLRATDEGVPGALAGWRPQVTINMAAGPAQTRISSPSVNPFTGQSQIVSQTSHLNENAESVTVTQPLYRGGKTRSSVNKAENLVMSQRATLLATEEQVFSDTVNAYVTVIQDQQLLALDQANEALLTKELQATNDRFRVGELTRTDVAQAEAALASATATRQTAEGTLQTARATYVQEVGEPPGKLVDPQPLKLPNKTLEEAKALAGRNNPNVVSALFADAAARDAFDVAYSALLPQLSLQGAVSHTQNQVEPGYAENAGTLLLNLSVPIYQGGSEYASIRQARQQELQARNQLEEQRRAAVQQVTAAWTEVEAARAAIISGRAAVRASQIAVEGLEREALVGSATTLDVLEQVQTLLNAQTALVQSLAQVITSSYQVAAAVGRLSARDLNLQVQLYDEKAYYNAVHDLWVGTGDFATDQPGR